MFALHHARRCSAFGAATILSLFVPLSLGCQDTNSKGPIALTDAIEVYDLGPESASIETFRNKGSVTRQFEVKNVSASNITFDVASKSCACISVILKSQIIEPSDISCFTVEIPVGIRAHTDYSAVILRLSQEGCADRFLQVPITTELFQSLWVDNSSLVFDQTLNEDFQKLRVYQRQCELAKNDRRGELRITQLPGWLEVTSFTRLDRNDAEAAVQPWELFLKRTRPLECGESNSGSLKIIDVDSDSSVAVYYHCQDAEHLRISPSSSDFGIVEIGSVGSVEILVHSISGASFTISEWKLSSELFQAVQLTEGLLPVHRFCLTFPAQEPGRFFCTLAVKSSGSVSQSAELTFQASGR